MRKISVLFIALCIACCSYVYADAGELGYDIDSVISDTAEYLTSVTDAPKYGAIGGEWLIVGLARGNHEVSEKYFDEYYKSLSDYVSLNNGILHTKKYTEYSRVVLALTAIGKNPYDVMGYNLINPLYEYDNVSLQGINGPIFALIALDSNNYKQSTESETNIRQKYVEYILERQNADGGFSLNNGGESDTDITAMALQALSGYKDNERCGAAVNSALRFLSDKQLASGGFESYNTENCESCCQVIVALSTLGVDINDYRFVKNGNSALDALMQFYSKGEGFKHTTLSGGENNMASEQALYALAAVKRYYEDKNSLYNMTDVIADNSVEDIISTLKPMPVIVDNIVFGDTAGNEYESEILALAKRSIINGKSENIFDPYATMTRAEFAAITVKALELPMSAADVFEDVQSEDWHYGYISAAYNAGIIKGVSETEFDPNGTITREQAAVMIERCGLLCGKPSVINDNEVNNILAQFDDYKSVSNWAASSLAFCYKYNILSQDVLDIEPQTMVMRCEVAHMVYGLLKSFNLISG